MKRGIGIVSNLEEKKSNKNSYLHVLPLVAATPSIDNIPAFGI